MYNVWGCVEILLRFLFVGKELKYVISIFRPLLTDGHIDRKEFGGWRVVLTLQTALFYNESLDTEHLLKV